MSLLNSLNAGASGVKTMGKAMTVIGSNVANVNTVGYKASQASFEDILASNFSQGIGKTKLSQGVGLASVNANFAQGSFEQTEKQTDMAINGNGFFTVKDKFDKSFYTRAGNFSFDGDGMLTTERGLFVQVKDIDPQSGDAVGFPHKLKVLGVVDPPLRTGDGTFGTGMSVKANLDANSPIREAPFDPTNVKVTMYNFSTSIDVFDDLGDEHTATVVFRKRPDVPPQTDPQTGAVIPGIKNQWEWYALFDGADVGQRPGQLVAQGGGFLQFDDDGRLLQATGGEFVAQPGGVDPATGQVLPAGPPILQPAPVNPETGLPQIVVDFGGNVPQVIGVNLGFGSNPDDPTDERTGLDGVTQFASASSILHVKADGHPSGTLEDVNVGTDGVITGVFDSGHTRPMGKVVLTKFDNPEQLIKAGDNLFNRSLLAGKAVVGSPGIGGFGTVRSQALEQSNVDLAKEFVKMVETQRAFQANAKTVTVSDEMVESLVNMKR